MTFAAVMAESYMGLYSIMSLQPIFGSISAVLPRTITRILPLDSNLPHISSIIVWFTCSLVLKMAIIDKVFAIPHCGTVHLLLANVQNF